MDVQPIWTEHHILKCKIYCISCSPPQQNINKQPCWLQEDVRLGDKFVFSRLLRMKSHPFLQKSHHRPMIEASIKLHASLPVNISAWVLCTYGCINLSVCCAHCSSVALLSSLNMAALTFPWGAANPPASSDLLSILPLKCLSGVMGDGDEEASEHEEVNQNSLRNGRLSRLQCWCRQHNWLNVSDLRVKHCSI